MPATVPGQPLTQAGLLPAEASLSSVTGLFMTIYQHIRHPRIASRRADRPVKVADLLPRGTAVNRFNTKVALLITRAPPCTRWHTCKATSPRKRSKIAEKIGLDPVPVIDAPPDEETTDQDPED
jgi:hypothetical protein